ncbi:MAG: hypothetical protein ACM3JH_04050 [Acidithiobacillales bacterium]
MDTTPPSDPVRVIVPMAGGEALPPASFFERVLGADGRVELVVAADRSLPEASRRALETFGATVVPAEGPRGARLAFAASTARGGILLFLHADTLLPIGWKPLVVAAVAAGCAGGAFRLAFDGGGARMVFVAFWANVRTAVTRVPYGDQAPFVRRDVYQRLGGHRPWPLLEDLEFGSRLKRAGRISILPAKVRTSPRRYLEKGILRTLIRNKLILYRYYRGESPERLAELYRR